MKIAIIGSGSEGLVSGACFAEWGNEVTCVDLYREKIGNLKCGKLPVYELGLEHLIERNTANGRLTFTTDMSTAVKAADVVFITVVTPTKANTGDVDLSLVYAAAKQIAPHLRQNAVVAIKSTAPVGTGDVVEKIITTARGCSSFSVASNPDFLRKGAAVQDFLRPDRVIIGVEDCHAENLLRELYSKHLQPLNVSIVITKRRTAELIKCATSAFLTTQIAFIDQLAELCHKLGSDVSDVALGMGLDKRIAQAFLSTKHDDLCFSNDIAALLRTGQECGVSLGLVQEALGANNVRKTQLNVRIKGEIGGDFKRRTVAVF